MTALERVKAFIRMLGSFQQVKRLVFVPGENRNENDVEHSYMLAMTAWQIVVLCGLRYDLNKILRYALVHDLPEVYAGDVSAFDEAARVGKKEREHLAIERLEKEFPEVPDIWFWVRRYEGQEDKEAQFVRSLDKIMPIFINQFDGGRTWKKNGITLAQLIELKRSTVTDPNIAKLFEEHLIELRDQEAKLF